MTRDWSLILPGADFMVDLPAGGRLDLNDADEVELWEESAKRYIDDYGLVKANDLMLLGAILSQAIAMYRAQRELNDAQEGVERAEHDHQGGRGDPRVGEGARHRQEVARGRRAAHGRQLRRSS